VIAEIFARESAPAAPAFIPYVMAGDPDLSTTEAILTALTRAGAALIELGIPYGDPLADGPTVAAAAQRALSGGTRVGDVLNLVERARADACAPVLLFTYYNPVDRYGVDRFAADAAAAGAWGAIVPDVPLEEIGELREALERRGLHLPLLVAPSTTRERAARIAEAAGGFVYVVSRLGVTGAGSRPDFAPLRGQLAALRDVTEKPLAVGFGVSRREHVVELSDAADGVIVGSAIIDAYAGRRGSEAAACVEAFSRGLLGRI